MGLFFSLFLRFLESLPAMGNLLPAEALPPDDVLPPAAALAGALAAALVGALLDVVLLPPLALVLPAPVALVAAALPPAGGGATTPLGNSFPRLPPAPALILTVSLPSFFLSLASLVVFSFAVFFFCSLVDWGMTIDEAARFEDLQCLTTNS